MKLLYHRWTVCFMAFFLTVSCIVYLIFFNDNTFINIFLIFFIPVMVYNTILESYVALTFISPTNRKVSLESEGWEQIKLQHQGPEIFTVRNMRSIKAPLVLMIHGWRSSSSSMLDRADLYIERGFHVIIMELPGHGSAEGVKKWNAGVPVRNLIHLFDNLDEVCNTSLISDIYFHGHSMGGFVFLRFSRESIKVRNSELIRGYILESPLTCYSRIFEESCKMLFVPKILRPLLWKRLMFHFNVINPSFDKITNLNDVDVPIWGLPNLPTLVIQSANDELLGQKHHDRLVKAFHNSGRNNLLTDRVIGDLTHTGARTNSSRNDEINKWLDKN